MWQLLQKSEWKTTKEDCKEANVGSLQEDLRDCQKEQSTIEPRSKSLFQLGRLWRSRREKVHHRRNLVETVVRLCQLYP